MGGDRDDALELAGEELSSREPNVGGIPMGGDRDDVLELAGEELSSREPNVGGIPMGGDRDDALELAGEELSSREPNVGGVPMGGGSDRDDALDLAARELMHGRYIYYPKTYHGNRISPLPGAVFLSVPFVLIGKSAYQNLFWLLILFLTIRFYMKDGRLALLVFWSIFALSPVALQQLVTGGDLLANVIYVLAFTLLLISVTRSPDANIWVKIMSAILLGIGLSSRANFLLVLPLVFSLLGQNIGWREAAKYSAIVVVTFAAVTLPFYLYDPEGFTPLATQSWKVAYTQSYQVQE